MLITGFFNRVYPSSCTPCPTYYNYVVVGDDETTKPPDYIYIFTYFQKTKKYQNHHPNFPTKHSNPTITEEDELSFILTYYNNF